MYKCSGNLLQDINDKNEIRVKDKNETHANKSNPVLQSTLFCLGQSGIHLNRDFNTCISKITGYK